MTTTLHHPFCPISVYSGAALDDILEGVDAWQPRCLCGPEAAEEDKVILLERTPDQMLLDVIAHADKALRDRYRR